MHKAIAICTGRRGISPASAHLSRRHAVALGIAVLVAAALSVFAPSAVRADEAQGYVSVSGVVGLDESQAFSSISEAAAAVAACDPEAQAADPAGAALVVHGTVALDAQSTPTGTFDLFYPIDGSTYAVVGADASARLQLIDSSGAGRAPVLAHAGGSLVLRGLTVSGPVGLSARDNLEVDACAFDASVSCFANGTMSVVGNSFCASHPVGSSALCASLLSPSSSLVFTGNDVSGYASGLTVAALQESWGLSLSITSNNFHLVSDAVDPAVGMACVASLTGGPWAPASVVCAGNVVEGAGAVFMLGSTFTMTVQGDEGPQVQGVAAADLSAQAMVSLFETAGHESVFENGCPVVGIAPAYAGDYLASQAAEASSILVPASASDAEAAPQVAPLVQVSYDGNGATAGEAPQAVVVSAGEAVSIAHMGSLVCPGCLFEGWNTASDGSGMFYAAGQVIVPEENTVLYAQWVPNGTVGTVAVTEQQPTVAVE